MKSISLTKCILIGIFSLCHLVGWCTTYTWTNGSGDGKWSTPTNWSHIGGNSYPQAVGDNVTFDATNTSNCTIDVTVAISSITVNAGYTGTISQSTFSLSFTSGTFSGGAFNGNNTDISFSGTLTISGTAFKSTSTNLNLGTSLVITSGSFNANNGTVVATGATTTLNVSISGISFYNIQVSNTTTTFDYSGGTAFAITNNFTINAGSSADVTLTGPSSGVVSVGGDITFTSSGYGVILSQGTLQLTGSGKRLDFSGTGQTASASGGGAGTIDFAGSNQSIVGNASIFRWFLPNIKISGTGTFTLSNTISVMGNWNITSSTVSIASLTSKVVFCPTTTTTTTATITVNSAVAWTLYDMNIVGNGPGTIGTGSGGGQVTFLGFGPTISDVLIFGSTYSTYMFLNSSITANAIKIQGSAVAGIEGAGTLYVNGFKTTGPNNYSVWINNTSGVVPSATLATIEFSGSGAQYIYNNTGISKVGMLPNVSINQGTGGTLDLGTSYIPVAGNWIEQATNRGTVSANSSILQLYNNANAWDQTLAAKAGMKFNSIYIEPNSTNKIVLGSDISVLGDLTGANASCKLDPSSSGYGISIVGNWNLPGDIYNPSGYAATVTLTGSNNAQTIKMNQSYPFYNLTVNKSAASNYATLASNISVNGTLTLTKGLITTTPAYSVNLNGGGSAPSSTSVGSTNSYINGTLQWTINAVAPFTQNINCNFPIGGTDWAPISINFLVKNSNTTIYKATMYNSSPITTFSGYALSSPIKKISNVRYWALSQTNSLGINADLMALTAYFNTNDQVTVPADLSLARATAPGPWNDLAIATRSSAGGPYYTGTIITQNITSVGNGTDIFTFDDDNTGNNPLPISVSGFTAVYDPALQKVDVHWRTESKEEGTYFTLQRADKSLVFESITTRTPNPQEDIHQDYSYTDFHPLPGSSYYRLKETDKHGIDSYHGVVHVNATGEKPAGIYPNPGGGSSVTIVMPSSMMSSASFMVEIKNTVGEEIANLQVSKETLSSELPITFSAPLAPGIYYIILKDGKGTCIMKYLVK